jgi:O-antigen ligase
MILRQPWLGYGYGGFWLGETGPSAAFWAAVGWKTPHSHNGFIDLALDLGLVGLFALVVALVTAFVRAIGRARTARTADAVAPLMFLAYTVLYNLSESSLLRHNTIFWVLYIMGTTGACGGVRHPTTAGQVSPGAR